MKQKDRDAMVKLLSEMMESEYNDIFFKLRDEGRALMSEVSRVNEEISKHQSILSQLEATLSVLNQKFRDLSIKKNELRDNQIEWEK